MKLTDKIEITNEANVFGLCVRWGFPALKPILKTKFNYMTELDLKNHSPNDAKPVLYEGGISRTTLSSKHVKRKRKNKRGKF